jgi:hypothetical protein
VGAVRYAVVLLCDGLHGHAVRCTTALCQLKAGWVNETPGVYIADGIA